MYKAIQDIGNAPGLRGNRQNRVEVAQNWHFAVLAGVRGVIQTGIVVGDALIAVGCDDGFIQ